ALPGGHGFATSVDFNSTATVSVQGAIAKNSAGGSTNKVGKHNFNGKAAHSEAKHAQPNFSKMSNKEMFDWVKTHHKQFVDVPAGTKIHYAPYYGALGQNPITGEWTQVINCGDSPCESKPHQIPAVGL